MTGAGVNTNRFCHKYKQNGHLHVAPRPEGAQGSKPHTSLVTKTPFVVVGFHGFHGFHGSPSADFGRTATLVTCPR